MLLLKVVTDYVHAEGPHRAAAGLALPHACLEAEPAFCPLIKAIKTGGFMAMLKVLCWGSKITQHPAKL